MTRCSLTAAMVAGLLAAAAGGARAADSAAPDVVATAPLLTLAEAVRAARAHHPALGLARGNAFTAWGNANQARSALLPNVNGAASYQRGTSNYVSQPGGMVPGMNAQPTVSSASTVPLWRFAVTGNQLVYDFGESINRWKAADVAADAADESVHVTESQVVYNARIAFFTARADKDLVAVARDTLANQEKHLAQVQGFVEVGTHPAIDLSQARADRATAQLQLINTENNYAVARAVLNQAMGVERSVDYDLSDDALPPIEGEEGVVEMLIDEAKQARPEMANLRLNLKSQELGLRSAHDMNWPALSLAGTAYESGKYLDSMAWNFSGTVQLSVPLLQGGAIKAQIKEAQGQLQQAQAQLETERQQVRLDVEQARLGIRAAKGAIASAEDALVNTQDRLRLAEGRYATGVGSIIELGDAQLALTNAAAQKVQAEYQLSTARAQLLKALGRND
ncbi:MAG TPA: TolC family protein [Polyangia bacterium]|nr:TolC family protein [Polyangia bacterium]